MNDRRAFALTVPLRTDPVALHRLVSGRLEVAGGSESELAVVGTALFFEIEEGAPLGRVTFEGLDSIRTSQGEYSPDDFGEDFSSWVYVVENWQWLVERHDYGIWLDVPEDDPLQVGGEHPLAGLPASTAPAKGSTAGLSWELVRSQRTEADLLDDARLCSQPLFAFNLILDGRRSGDATAWLRVRDGVATSRFARSWVG
jgi:hypothetical protein